MVRLGTDEGENTLISADSRKRSCCADADDSEYVRGGNSTVVEPLGGRCSGTDVFKAQAH